MVYFDLHTELKYILLLLWQMSNTSDLLDVWIYLENGAQSCKL